MFHTKADVFSEFFFQFSDITDILSIQKARPFNCLEKNIFILSNQTLLWNQLSCLSVVFKYCNSVVGQCRNEFCILQFVFFSIGAVSLLLQTSKVLSSGNVFDFRVIINGKSKERSFFQIKLFLFHYFFKQWDFEPISSYICVNVNR